MSKDEVMELIRKRIAEAGGKAAFAETVGFSVSYVSDILNDNRGLSAAFVDALGLEEITTYRRKVA